MPDGDTGIEETEHGRFIRWGEGPPPQRSTPRAARAGKDNGRIRGGISLSGVSKKSVTIMAAA